VKNEGVDFQDDAVEEILRVTERYSYFIQEWGFHVWNSAPESPIQLAHVQEATPGIIAHLDANFFRVRFDRFDPAPAEISSRDGGTRTRSAQATLRPCSALIGPNRRDRAPAVEKHETRRRPH
jgi:hypothetical protein